MTTIYRPEIDGLRAVAVLPVILFHAGFSWFSGGYVGVDVFFVISGYLITSIILDDLHQGTFSLAHFYERRARRILPALFFVMAACIPFAWILLIPRDLKDFGESLAAVSTFSSNILFWLESGYFATEAGLKPLLHTWSLAVEEQYYILFPLLLMTCWRFGVRWIVWIIALSLVASLVLAHWGAYNKPTATFYLLPTRGWELFLGALAAFHLRRKTRLLDNKPANRNWPQELIGISGLALILIAIISFDRSVPFPSLYALLPTLGAVLIILGAHEGTMVARLLGSRMPVTIGLMSYSAYLWHQPLLAFGHYQSLHAPSALLMGLLCGLTLPLAWLTWRYVEAPFRDRKRFSRRTIFSCAAGTAGVFIVIGLTLSALDGVPERLPEGVIETVGLGPKYVGERDDDPCNLHHEHFVPPACVKGSKTRAAVGLIGDSHAASLVHELTREFEQRGQSFVQYTKNGCPFGRHIENSEAQPCSQFVDAVIRDVNEKDLDTLILLAQWSSYIHEYDFDNGVGGKSVRHDVFYTVRGTPLTADIATRRRAILDAYVDTIKVLQNGRRKIYVVLPVPEQGWDVPKYLGRIAMRGDPQVDVPASPLSVYRSRNAELMRVFNTLADDPSIIFVDSTAAFCNLPNRSGCISSIAGEALYYDDNHLTNRGAAMLLREIFTHVALPMVHDKTP
jgi:peptidoglycan/LPS O-acetylase OafA/YrhL